MIWKTSAEARPNREGETPGELARTPRYRSLDVAGNSYAR